MTTVINNPGENNGDGASGGAGVVIGAVLVILVLVIVIVLSMPYMRERFDAMSRPGNPTINVQLPTPPVSNTPVTPK